MIDLGQGGGLTAQLTGPFSGGGDSGRMCVIFLPADGWKGAEWEFQMQIAVENISNRSRIDLYPSGENLTALRKMGCGLVIKIIRTTDSKITNARLPSRTILCFFICVPSFPLFCHQAFFLLSQR